MNRYRIGEDGKLTLEESLLGSFLGGKEVQEILTKAGNDVSFISDCCSFYFYIKYHLQF